MKADQIFKLSSTDPVTQVKTWKERTPLPLGQVATLMAAGGFIPMAQELLNQGVVLEDIPVKVWNAFHFNQLIPDHLKPTIAVPPLFAVFGSPLIANNTLNHIIPCAPFWERVDFVLNNSNARLSDEFDGHNAFTIPSQTVEKFQDKTLHLINRGVNINTVPSSHTPIGAILKSCEQLRVSYDDHAARSCIQWVLDQGFLIDNHDAVIISETMQVQHISSNTPQPIFWSALQSFGVKNTDENGSIMQNTPLAQAIHLGFHKLVPFFTHHSKTWVDQVTKDTLIGVAVRSGASGIRALLTLDPKDLTPVINQPNSRQDRPIHQVVRIKHASLTDFVIKAGANLTVQNGVGKTALETLNNADKNSEQLKSIISMFEKQGALSDQGKDHSLLKACALRQWELAQQLLKKGADPTVIHKQKNALLMACNQYTSDHHDLIISLIDEMLSKGCGINDQVGHQTALTVALDKNHLTLVEHLLTHSPDCSLAYKKTSPLHLLAQIKIDHSDQQQASHALICEKMIKLGADINALSDGNESVLLVMIYHHFVPSSLHLMECGAKPVGQEQASQMMSGVNRWPKERCASSEKIKLMKHFIGHGGDVNYKDAHVHATNMLYDAIHLNDYQVFDFLLAQGATLENKKPYGLLSKLHTSDGQGIFKALNNMGMSLSIQQGNLITQMMGLGFFNSQEDHQLQALNFLLSQGFDANPLDASPLCHVINYYENWQPKRHTLNNLAKLLVHHGADPFNDVVQQKLENTNSETQMFIMALRAQYEKGILQQITPSNQVQAKNKKM